MRYLFLTIIFGTTFICYGQDNFEQIALNYFDKTIRPEFVEFKGGPLIFFFKGKSTDKLSDLDFSSTKRPLNQYYKVDLESLGLGKCEHVDKKAIESIELKRPDGLEQKRRYVNRHLYVHLWKLRLWKRNEKGQFNVYVDRVTKCGQAHIVNITLYPTIDSYWYTFLIYLDDKGNVTEWYYVNYIA